MALYTVIGAAGFIGSRMADTLRAAGEEVFAPRRDDPDLLGRELGRVLYCAGLTGDYRTRPFATVEAHVTQLATLLEHARFERLVYLSSTRTYQTTGAADGREAAPLALDPGDPEQVYELSKALGENLAVHRSAGRGCAARLSYVFDGREGSTGFLSEWLSLARTARDLSIASTPQGARDYIHLDDVVRALRAMADSDVNAIVNVASGQVTTNREIAEVFAAEGWRVSFAGRGDPSPAVKVDVERLARLGIHPRAPLDLIREFLRGL